MPRAHELQLDRAEKFLKHERTAQRVGVVALTAFVLAGAAGLFGTGPLSEIRTTEAGAELAYQRFGRMSAPLRVMISAATDARDGEPVRFRIERDFLKQVTFLHVNPPDALRGLDETTGIFEVRAFGGRGHLELHYKPEKYGVLETMVETERGGSVHLWQLIYF